MEPAVPAVLNLTSTAAKDESGHQLIALLASVFTVCPLVVVVVVTTLVLLT